MSWFGLILVFALFLGQSKCDKDQPNIDHKTSPFSDPMVMKALARSDLNNCPFATPNPICLLIQHFFPETESEASNSIQADPNSTPHFPEDPNSPPGFPGNLNPPDDLPEVPNLPAEGQLKRNCMNCPGPECTCSQGPKSTNGLQPQPHGVPPNPNPVHGNYPQPYVKPPAQQNNTFSQVVEMICHLNSVGYLPSVTVTLGCTIAKNKEAVWRLIEEIWSVIKKILRLLPFGKWLLPKNVYQTRITPGSKPSIDHFYMGRSGNVPSSPHQSTPTTPKGK